MKKEFDLVKFKKSRDIYVNKMEPKGLIFYGYWFALIIGAIFYDLESIFNIEFLYVKAICGLILFLSCMYCLCWAFCWFYYAIKTKYLMKKFPHLKEDLKYEDK